MELTKTIIKRKIENLIMELSAIDIMDRGLRIELRARISELEWVLELMER